MHVVLEVAGAAAAEPLVGVALESGSFENVGHSAGG